MLINDSFDRVKKGTWINTLCSKHIKENLTFDHLTNKKLLNSRQSKINTVETFSNLQTD